MPRDMGSISSMNLFTAKISSGQHTRDQIFLNEKGAGDAFSNEY